MRIFLGADAVVYAEGETEGLVLARVPCPSGVCVTGMRERTQSRNLGDPALARKGRGHRSSTQDVPDQGQEVGWSRSSEEAE